MTEAEWIECGDPREMLDFLWERESDRKLRLFAVACCRCSPRILREREYLEALETSTRFADGRATEDDLSNWSQAMNDRAGRLGDGRSKRDTRQWAEAMAVANALGVVVPFYSIANCAADAAEMIGRAAVKDVTEQLAAILRDICGNPFRRWREWKTIRAVYGEDQFHQYPPAWITPQIRLFADGIYTDRDFAALPVLADLAEEAGCTDSEVLRHCREPREHVLGCWVVDMVLGKT